MPSNIEIKARVGDLGRLRGIVRRLADDEGRLLEQQDIFFQVPKGRLKLRIYSDSHGELIQYSRPDTAAAKRSDYQIHVTAAPQELRAVLAAALGETVRVNKTREVYMVGHTRVHLDQVEGLGMFMELEVVLNTGQDPEEGRAIAAELMEQLGVGEEDLVHCAYADLLQSS